MNEKFQLSCESTVDMPYEYIHSRGIEVLFYTYVIDGRECADDMGRTPGALEEFHKLLAAGKKSVTSQVTAERYEAFFERLLQKGDVLHIAFGSGMTPSVNNAMEAAEKLRKKYPERRIEIVDSLCSSSGYGLLVDVAADMRDKGDSLSEVKEWAVSNCEKVHHQFFSTDLTQFKRSGRVSGPAAMVATLLGICPLMRLNKKGQIIAYDKVKGKKRVISATADAVLEHIQNGKAYDGKLIICNSQCRELAEQMRTELVSRLENFTEEKIPITDIGPVIATHCGQGTVAVFFFGDERAE